MSPAERSALGELAFGRLKPSLCRVTRLGECTPLLFEKPAAHLLLWGVLRPLYLRSRVVSRPRRQRPLIQGEFLDSRLLKCASEAGERVAVVEVVEVAFVLARRACDVEAGLRPRPREG